MGFAVAEASLENGCDVIISSSNPERVANAVERLRSSDPSAAAAATAAAKERISGHACDLGNEETLETNLKALFEKVGKGIEHVVLHGGGWVGVGLVRFVAPLFIGKLAPAYMNPGPSASIILTTGSVAERPVPGWTLVDSYATGLFER
ncbi:hypothetical protein BST61_g7782 [Cercospora zeina]